MTTTPEVFAPRGFNLNLMHIILKRVKLLKIFFFLIVLVTKNIYAGELTFYGGYARDMNNDTGGYRLGLGYDQIFINEENLGFAWLTEYTKYGAVGALTKYQTIGMLLMLNYRFNITEKITIQPELGPMIGFNFVDDPSSFVDDNQVVLGARAGFGASYQISRSFVVRPVWASYDFLTGNKTDSWKGESQVLSINGALGLTFY